MAFQLPIFPNPSSINVKFSVHKKPTFATLIQTPRSGREVTRYQQTSPFWEYQLEFEILRDQSQNSTLFAPTTGFQELQTLSAFWLSRNGQYGAFLYSDPDDFSRTGQVIATGNGALTSFPIVRTFGTGTYVFVEQVGIVDVRTGSTVNVYLNGVLLAQSGNWWIDTDLRTLRFVVPPGNGVVITMDFSFFYFCRFIEDKLDLEEFMTGRWSLKALKFRSTMPDPPSSGNNYSIPNQNTTLTTPQTLMAYYFEVKVLAARSGARICVGLADASFNLTNPIQLDLVPSTYASLTHGFFFYLSDSNSGMYTGSPGPQSSSFGGGNYVNQTIGIVYNQNTNTWWARTTFAPGTWIGGSVSPTPDPTTGTNGFPISNSTITVGNVFILCGAGWENFPPGTTSHAECLLNTGGSAFAMVQPANTQPWGGTLNSGDRAAQIVLTAGNLDMTTTDISGANQPTAFVRGNTAR